MEMIRIAFAGFLLAACVIAQATAADIRIACYSDGNECEVTQDLARRFMKDNPDVHHHRQACRTRRSWRACRCSSPRARAGYRPYDRLRRHRPIFPRPTPAAEGRRRIGMRISARRYRWMRTGSEDKGIYGLPTQLTVTAPFVNKTLFEQAGRAVARPQGDLGRLGRRRRQRSPRRRRRRTAWPGTAAAIASPVRRISIRRQVFRRRRQRRRSVDDGFKAMASRFVNWNQDGIDREGGVGGRPAAAIATHSRNSPTARSSLYLSGSWQLARDGEADRRRLRVGGRAEPVRPGGLHAACPAAPRSSRSSTTKIAEGGGALSRLPGLASRSTPRWMGKTANIPASRAAEGGRATTSSRRPAMRRCAAFTLNGAEDLAGRLSAAGLSATIGSIFNATVDRSEPGDRRRRSRSTRRYQRITADVTERIAAAKK